MEGNRFHDPGTPPPIELGRLRTIYSRQISNEDTVISDAASDGKSEVEERINISESSSDAFNSADRRKSHREEAFQLVDNVTRQSPERRPSKAGILSHLLKLKGFEDKQKRHQNQLKSSPSTSHLQNAPQVATSSRPTHQLRSIASSRALLQTMGASPQSARSSMYFDDLIRAEQGIVDDTAVAANRLEIASEIAEILQRQDLIIKLGKSLVRTGAPSHRIEAAMDQVGKRLEIDGSYAVLPGLIIVTFGDVETHTSETHLIRCSRSLDIGKLERSNVIAYRLAKGELDMDEATEALDNIINGPPTWNPYVVILGYVVTSALVAPLFYNGSWTDCWVSAIFGLCVGILTYISERVPMFGNVFEMVVTIPVAIITMVFHPYVCFAAVAMAAIVIALPGYSLTCAVMELAAKNLISGVVHLTYAMVYVLFLAFGIGYGCSIWRLAHPEFDFNVLTTCANNINPWWTFFILPLATIGFGVVYGASPNQWLPMVADSGLGYAVYYFVSKYAGATSVITPSAGAFALGLGGNIYSRITKRLAFVPLMGGIIVLVPGSIGVRGAVHLFDGSGGATGSEFVFQVLAIALSLTLGLFLANLVVYPNGKKRTVFLGF